MAVVASISTTKQDKDQFKQDMTKFRLQLSQMNCSQNLSLLFRTVINSTIETDSDGNSFIIIPVERA